MLVTERANKTNVQLRWCNVHAMSKTVGFSIYQTSAGISIFARSNWLLKLGISNNYSLKLNSGGYLLSLEEATTAIHRRWGE